MSLEGKHILLGVTGSIAAYKAAYLVRLLVKQGAQVRIIMTPLAKEFITPLTLATLAKSPILVDFFNPENGDWNSHVSLGEWADLYIIAPATANTIAKMATGVADNLLLTTYLSARCPVVISPAMDLDMYAHAATQRNLSQLAQEGVGIVEPGSGELASGLMGKGRMAEPEEIVTHIEHIFARSESLTGRRFVVTAGATIEPIDPVRYISNHSTGKMGFALAQELASRGATVTLIAGRSSLESHNSRITRVDVGSAEQMYMATKEAFEGAHVGIMCAAVADYTPVNVASEKIKKLGDQMTIELRRTVDIAAQLGACKGTRLLVGFALETENERANALDKMERKNFDMIVLNSLQDAGAGFGTDTNKVTIFDRNGGSESSPLESKRATAARIVNQIEKLLNK